MVVFWHGHSALGTPPRLGARRVAGEAGGTQGRRSRLCGRQQAAGSRQQGSSGALAVCVHFLFPRPHAWSSGPGGEDDWLSLLILEFDASTAGTELKKHARKFRRSRAHWLGLLFAQLQDQNKKQPGKYINLALVRTPITHE